MGKVKKFDYSKPIEIAQGIYWLGFVDKAHDLYSNPYIIIEGDEAIVIDGGNRPDFSTVMTKILQTGFAPSAITRLIYQHYDPDLCGSIPDFEEIIDRNDLKIISHNANHAFIKYYSVLSELQCIEELNFEFTFKTGRRLRFIRTPYAHCQGSFITYDEKTQTLFSSDIFGSYDKEWNLYLELFDNCIACDSYLKCPLDKHCYVSGIIDFNKSMMPSDKALQYALERIKILSLKRIAPQHGSLIEGEKNTKILLSIMEKLRGVGIDGIM